MGDQHIDLTFPAVPGAVAYDLYMTRPKEGRRSLWGWLRRKPKPWVAGETHYLGRVDGDL